MNEAVQNDLGIQKKKSPELKFNLASKFSAFSSNSRPSLEVADFYKELIDMTVKKFLIAEDLVIKMFWLL